MTSWPPFTLRNWATSKPSTATYDVMHGVLPHERTLTMCQMNWFGVALFDPKQKREWALPSYDESPCWRAPVNQQQCDFP